MITTCPHIYPKRRIQKLKERYKKLSNIDELLEVMRSDRSYKGASYYDYPTREGNTIYMTKVPEENTSTRIASFFTPEIQYWESNILAWAEEKGLDPNLVATVMQIESCGDPLAESPAGAIGLFQVMPYHLGLYIHSLEFFSIMNAYTKTNKFR